MAVAKSIHQRNSKTAKSINVDFTTTICSALKPYQIGHFSKCKIKVVFVK